MDKDRFRNLLQAFEQLSVKPEVELDTASTTAALPTPSSATPEPQSGLVTTLQELEPSETEVDQFLAQVRDKNTSFPELEATYPGLDNSELNASALLKEMVGGGGLAAQTQLHVASRFRLTANVAAHLHFRLQHILKSTLVGRQVSQGLGEISSGLMAVCSASLLEAAQIERRAMEPSAVSGSSAAGLAHSTPVTPQESPVISQAVHSAVADEAAVVRDSRTVALGARIREFSRAWTPVTADPWVLETVTCGLQFDFVMEPEHVETAVPEYNDEEREAIERVVQWDLGDRVIEEIEYSPELFVSHMYTIKVAGNFKALLECRPINKYLEAGSYVVKEMPSLLSLMHPGDFITRINIKCAYMSVPIHKDHQRYLVFEFDGKYYQYRTLPFGISVGSKVFTKLLQAALQPLRTNGFRIVSHIDELCLLNGSAEELAEQTQVLCRHLTDLGFLINTPTSDLVPQQNQRFLGFVFNTVECKVQVPRDQIKKVRRAAHTARSGSITAKQLASLIGKIRSIMPAVGPEHKRIREIEQCLDNSVTTPESWDDRVVLSPGALEEIDWLCDNVLSQKTMVVG